MGYYTLMKGLDEIESNGTPFEDSAGADNVRGRIRLLQTDQSMHSGSGAQIARVIDDIILEIGKEDKPFARTLAREVYGLPPEAERRSPRLFGSCDGVPILLSEFGIGRTVNR